MDECQPLVSGGGGGGGGGGVRASELDERERALERREAGAYTRSLHTST